jgi:hypothetical protein
MMMMTMIVKMMIVIIATIIITIIIIIQLFLFIYLRAELNRQWRISESSRIETTTAIRKHDDKKN